MPRAPNDLHWLIFMYSLSPMLITISLVNLVAQVALIETRGLSCCWCRPPARWWSRCEIGAETLTQMLGLSEWAP